MFFFFHNKSSMVLISQQVLQTQKPEVGSPKLGSWILLSQYPLKAANSEDPKNRLSFLKLA